MTPKENKDCLSSKKLLVVARSGLAKREGIYSANPNEGVFLDELAGYFDEIILCVNIYEGSDLKKYPQNFEAKSYELNTQNITIVELKTSSYINFLGKVIQYFKRYQAVKKASSKVDYMFFFSTGYLGILSSFIACTFSIPSIVYVGGDWSDLIKHKSLKKNAFKRFMLLRYSEFISLIQDYSRNSADIRLIRGNELFTRYKKENSYKLPPMTNIRRRDIKKIDDLTITHGDKSKILFVGRMETENGINDFVEACGIIKSSHKTPFEMNIVGQGPLFKSVKERVSQLNLEANFLGYVENGQKLIDIYRKNKILVIPVLRAGLPRVLIEGFSQGLAIVASETGGIPHLVSDGDNGLLFKAGDYKNMANCILKLMNDKDLCQKFSRAGIEMALTQITDQTTAEFTAEKIRLHLS